MRQGVCPAKSGICTQGWRVPAGADSGAGAAAGARMGALNKLAMLAGRAEQQGSKKERGSIRVSNKEPRPVSATEQDEGNSTGASHPPAACTTGAEPPRLSGTDMAPLPPPPPPLPPPPPPPPPPPAPTLALAAAMAAPLCRGTVELRDTGASAKDTAAQLTALALHKRAREGEGRATHDGHICAHAQGQHCKQIQAPRTPAASYLFRRKASPPELSCLASTAAWEDTAENSAAGTSTGLEGPTAYTCVDHPSCRSVVTAGEDVPENRVVSMIHSHTRTHTQTN